MVLMDAEMSKWWLLEKKSKAKWNRYHILISLLRGKVLRAFKNIIIWKIVIVKEKNLVFSHSSIISNQNDIFKDITRLLKYLH